MAATITAVALLLTISLVAAQPADAVSLATAARSLAENVLGPGTVRALTIADQGATVLLRWESATYRSELQVEQARELIFGEAELATGSILGRLSSVARVRFSIVVGDRVIAGGHNVRGAGVQIQFAPSLGGGTFVAKPAPESSKSGTASARYVPKD